ncbi:hypothetical protein NEAUS04_0532, partial [Nematocida ausubeli]
GGQAAMAGMQAQQLRKIRKSEMVLHAAEAASINSATQASRIAKAAMAVTEIGAKEAAHAKDMAAIAHLARVEHQQNTSQAMRNYEAMQRMNYPTQLVRSIVPVSAGSIAVQAPAATAVAVPAQIAMAGLGAGAGAGGLVAGGGVSVMKSAPMMYGVVGGGTEGVQCICPPIYNQAQEESLGEASADNGFGARLAAGLASQILSEAYSTNKTSDSDIMCVELIKSMQNAANLRQQVAEGRLSYCLNEIGKSSSLSSMLAENRLCYC